MRTVYLTCAAMASGLGSNVAASAADMSSGTKIVYRCEWDLCRVDPATGIVRQITFDGRAFDGYYADPSLSRDGRVLTFTLRFSGNMPYDRLYVARSDASDRRPIAEGLLRRPLLRPNGREVLFVTACRSPGPTCGLVTRQPVRSQSGQVVASNFNYATVGWDGGRILMGGSTGNRIAICHFRADRKCRDVVARTAPSADMDQPAMSPNRQFVAAVVSRPGGYRPLSGSIRLYRRSTGSLVRTLTAGRRDATPVWSPDGRWIAFYRGARPAGIWIVPTDGSAPPRRLVRGAEPTWGASRPGK